MTINNLLTEILTIIRNLLIRLITFILQSQTKT